jgi:hypothetical protein
MNSRRHVDPHHITPLHVLKSSREHHLRELMVRLRTEGWQGRPLVVEDTSPHRYQAWTGTHRLAAARRVNLHRVPVVLIDKDKWIRRWGRPRKGRLFVDEVGSDMDKYVALLEAGDLVAARVLHQEIELNLGADAQRCGVRAAHTCL